MQEEPLDAILSPELDKMVTDGKFGQVSSLTSVFYCRTHGFLLLRCVSICMITLELLRRGPGVVSLT